VGLSNFWRRANNFDTARQARTAKPPKLRLAVTVPGLHDRPLQTTTSACTLSPHSAIIVDAASPTRHTLHPRPTPHATDPITTAHRRLKRRHALRNGLELGEVPEELRRRRGRGEEDHAPHRRVSLPACGSQSAR
jgi:hypothetical protein